MISKTQESGTGGDTSELLRNLNWESYPYARILTSKKGSGTPHVHSLRLRVSGEEKLESVQVAVMAA